MMRQELLGEGSEERAAAPAGALPQQVARVAEVALIMSLPPLCGLWLRPEDPLFVRGGFPWLGLSPLLLGLRRGSFVGGLSALSLVALVYLGHLADLPALVPYPTGVAAFFVVLGLVSGEFHDHFNRRLRALHLRTSYLDHRLRLFARAHHLLALSHEALEQQLLGECQSLRDALLQLQQRALPCPRGLRLQAIAEPLMELFAGFGWLHRAALYRVTEDGEIAGAPLACLGAPLPCAPAQDPVVRCALESGELAVVGEATQCEPAIPGHARVAVPIVDLSGRCYGVLAVIELAFSAFTDRYLTMLALLGGHVGDLLRGGTAEGEAEFLERLRRCVEDARRYRVPSALVGLVIQRDRAPDGLAEELRLFHRSLDLSWALSSPSGDSIILYLLPLIDEGGLAGFLKRLEARLGQRGDAAMACVRTHSRLLLGAAAHQDVLKGLLMECGVAA